MITEQALLGAIAADPADHTARLALADWLEEAGRVEQAEVARLHARQLMKVGTGEELARLCALLQSGVRPVVPEVVNSIGMRLALIPPGAFLMGSPQKERCQGKGEHQHEVRLTRPFYLGVFAVTQAEYERVAGANPSYFSPGGKGKAKVEGQDTGRFPVEQVSWYEAAAFCEGLTEKERKEGKIGDEQEYRLPTEAQWEYSCRGGAAFTQVFHFGDALSSTLANFDGNNPYGADEGTSLGRTCTVGSYSPNAFGLYDMHGNVWEWCHDWLDQDTVRDELLLRIDPRGPQEGWDRAFRGGGYDSLGRVCRSAQRHSFGPNYHLSEAGFRVSLVPSGR